MKRFTFAAQAACPLLLAAMLVLQMQAGAATYYVDATTGNDAGTGTTPAAAWQSLNRVNAMVFLPGDTILFKSGSVWQGQLALRGSGTAQQPLILSSYGQGPKPRIDGNGISGTATIYLYNVQYWELSNLEVTNNASDAADRRGVLVAGANAGTLRHIYLRNLEIHDVRGIVGQDDAAKRTAGIGIETASDASADTRFDDILIEGCLIYAVENTGLYTDNLTKRNDYPRTDAWYKRCFTNVRIRNNTIHHIAKNAMILRLLYGGVVEYNTCYETALQETGNTIYTISAYGVVLQYNEGYFNRSSGADGSLYDADLRTSNCIFQYSYSHDNAHGLFWSCTVQQDSGIIVRYNISQNDRGIIFCVNYPTTSIEIYNNTVFIGAQYAPSIIGERNMQSGTRSYTFRNNIIYNNSPLAKYDFRSAGYTRVIENNIFYGNHPATEPADAYKITANPLLAAPGMGGLGLQSVSGYKLTAGSPAINSGARQANHPTADFWNTPIPAGAQVDRGASEFQPATGLGGCSSNSSGFALQQNYPNPFNPVTGIRFSLRQLQHVRLSVLDLLGREVIRLIDGERAAGEHLVHWRGEDATGKKVSSGIYFALLASAGARALIKMSMVD